MGRGNRDHFSAIFGNRRGTGGTGDARPDGPPVPISGEDFLAAEERIGQGASPEYRGLIADLNLVISGEFTHKQSSGALYRAHIGFATDRANNSTERYIYAFCTYGAANLGDRTVNVVYKGTDLKAACKKLNSQMRSKMRVSRSSERYRPNSGNPDDALITEEDFRRAFFQRDPAFGGTPAAS